MTVKWAGGEPRSPTVIASCTKPRRPNERCFELPVLVKLGQPVRGVLNGADDYAVQSRRGVPGEGIHSQAPGVQCELAGARSEGADLEGEDKSGEVL